MTTTTGSEEPKKSGAGSAIIGILFIAVAVYAFGTAYGWWE